MNKVILIGRLGQDPDLRQTNSGSSVCTLNLATSEKRKDKDGTWSDFTEWHKVVCFGKQAENVARYQQKGSQLCVEGKIQTRKWQDKEGNNRYSTEIIADHFGGITFLDRKGDNSRQDEGYSGGGGYAPQNNQSGYDPDSMPF